MASNQFKKFLSRRRFAGTFGGAVLAGLAGCSGGGGGDDRTEATATTAPAGEADATVAVGPGGSLRFEPASTAVSRGDTVEFVFDSDGHNASGHPDAHPDVSLPEGAEPFASYDISGDNINHASLNEAGTTYRHTFETTGQYTYVCVPHAGLGMVGQVTVR